jgi:diacylglycerol kinase
MLKKRMKSLVYALQGIQFLFLSQFHAKIHLFFSIAVITAGWYFQVSLTEWLFLLLCIGSVWSLEALNTAIEQIVDFVSPEYHEKAKNAKDLAAGAVLIAAIISSIIGFSIFIPHLIKLL